MSTPVKIVFGAAGIGNSSLQKPTPGSFDVESEKGVAHVLDTLKDLKVNNLDTAQIYGESEATIGKQPSRTDFVIDTKIGGGFNPGNLTKDKIVAQAKDGIKNKLKVDQVDIYYIHAPDDSADIEDALAGIDAAHKAGLFKRFGLSNFQAADVEKIYSLAKSKGYVLPSAYQGNYSPVARLQETVLFPTLRKLNIAFYAYSPLAGGFLTKTREDITAGKGRFDKSTMIGAMYAGLYSKESYLEALSKWETAAKEEGVPKAELAYRWVAHHSPLKGDNGDAIIIGARSEEQLRGTVEGIRRGPLSDKAAKAIDDIWETIKHDAPLDNYHSHAKQS